MQSKAGISSTVRTGSWLSQHTRCNATAGPRRIVLHSYQIPADLTTMRRSRLAFAIAFAMLVGVPAAPQSKSRGTLTGVVLGPGGKPVANAVVTYQSGGGDTPHAVRTDAHGRFTIVKLRRDNYDLRASSHGLFSTWEKNVMVRSGQVKSVTLRLTNGAETAKTSVAAPRQ